MKNFFLKRLAPLFFLLLGLGAGCIRVGSVPQGPMGVFRSEDRGERWVPIAAYPTAQGVQSIAGVKVYRMVTDPSDPNAIYLATRGQGLFYTYDAGATWQSAAALAGKFIYSLAVDPKDKCTIYVTDGSHIYKSSDCNRTWQLSYAEEQPSQRIVAVGLDYGNSRQLYAALLGGDIIASDDAGGSWRVIKRFGTDIQYLATDPNDPGRIYVASYRNGLFRSDNGGGTWLNLSQGLTSFSGSESFYRLILHPSQKDTIFWVSRYGVLRSNDAGATWSAIPLIPPPGSVNIYAFAVSPKNDSELYFTATILGENQEHVRSTFYRSDDGGKAWVTKKLPTNTIPVGLYIHPENPNVLFMGFTIAN